VLCMDEKTSIQALDHTQASLPMTKGRAGTVTSDYKRHGTTTLFAALNALDGTVIGSCMDKHRHEEFLKFLRTREKVAKAALPQSGRLGDQRQARGPVAVLAEDLRECGQRVGPLGNHPRHRGYSSSALRLGWSSGRLPNGQ